MRLHHSVSSGCLGALAEVRRNPVRSGLTVFGISVGIGAIVGTGLLVQGSLGFMNAELGRLVGLQNIGVSYTSFTKQGGRWIPARVPNPFTSRDVALIRSLLKGELAAAALRVTGTYTVEWQGGSDAISVDRTDADFARLRQLTVIRGRFLSDADAVEARRVAVITAGLAAQIFGDGSAVGREMSVGRVWFRVIGVVSGAVPYSEGKERTIYVPSTVPGPGPSLTPVSTILHFEALPGADVDELARVIRNVLLSAHPEVDPKTVECHTATTMRKQSIAIIAFVAAVFLIVASLCLITGGVGVMNTLLTTVRERTREIGLRRALGARARDIFTQFFAEALALTALGGCVGVLSGIVLAKGLAWIVNGLLSYATGSSSLRIEVGADPAVIGATSFLIVGIALVFGVFPAFRASNLQPVDALREE